MSASNATLRPLYRSLTDALRAVAQSLPDFVKDARTPAPEGLRECAQVAETMGLVSVQAFCCQAAELAERMRKASTPEGLRLLASSISAIGMHTRALAEDTSTSYGALSQSFGRLLEALGIKPEPHQIAMSMFRSVEASLDWRPADGSSAAALHSLLAGHIGELREPTVDDVRAFLKRMESRNCHPGVKVFLDAAMCALEIDPPSARAVDAVAKVLADLAKAPGAQVDVFAVSTLLSDVKAANLRSTRAASLMRRVINEGKTGAVDADLARKYVTGLDKLRDILKRSSASNDTTPIHEGAKQLLAGSTKLGSVVVGHLSQALVKATAPGSAADQGMWIAAAMAIIVMRLASELGARGISEDDLNESTADIVKMLHDDGASAMDAVHVPRPLVEQIRLAAAARVCDESEILLRAIANSTEDIRRLMAGGAPAQGVLDEHTALIGNGYSQFAGLLGTLGGARASGVCRQAAITAIDPRSWSDPEAVQFLVAAGSMLSLLFARMRGGVIDGIDAVVSSEMSGVIPLDEVDGPAPSAHDERDSELMGVFIEESIELVEVAEVSLRDGEGWVRAVMRLMHTVKGSARVAGLPLLADALVAGQLAMEDLDDRVTEGHSPTPEQMEAARRGTTMLRGWLEALKGDHGAMPAQAELEAMTALFAAEGQGAAQQDATDLLDGAELDLAPATPAALEPTPEPESFTEGVGQESSPAIEPESATPQSLGAEPVEPPQLVEIPQLEEIQRAAEQPDVNASDTAPVASAAPDMAAEAAIGSDFVADALSEPVTDDDVFAASESSAPAVDVAELEASLARAADEHRDRAIDASLLSVLRDEVGDLAPQIIVATKRWAAGDATTDDIVAIRRHVHTIKGGLRTGGLMKQGAILHGLEDLLDSYEGTEKALLAQTDLAGVFERAALGALRSVDADAAPVTAADGSSHAPAVSGTVRVSISTVASISKASGESAILQRRTSEEVAAAWRHLRDLEQHMERVHGLIAELEIEAEVRIQAGRASVAGGQFDAIEFDRFTRLQELTRSLSESVTDITDSANGIGERLAKVGDAEVLREAVADGIQEEATRLMVAPLANHRHRLERVLMQACSDAGKTARLVLHGEADVPGPVMERLLPAIEHVLRNSIAHGIESPAIRQRIGKAAEGVVEIITRSTGAGLCLVVRDDGAGVDTERVLERALSSGLAVAGRQYSREQILDFLFMPGFSTADRVSELAGRGIGLDAVRSAVAEIGGSVEIESEPGAGATFTINAPSDISTMAVIPVEAGGATLMLPAALVDKITSWRRAGSPARVDAGGLDCRLVDLAAAMGMPTGPGAQRPTVSLVVVGAGSGDPTAYVVDSIGAQRKVVVRPLGRHIASLPGLVAGTVDGDGTPILIVNPSRMRSIADTAASRREGVKLVMLVDDSSTVRMAGSKALQRSGFEVVTAKDGIDALEKITRGIRPDAFALDIEMPRMDGFGLTKELRAMAEFGTTPIFIVSSRVGTKHREHAQQLGVDGFLGKPVQADELARLIREHLSRATTSRQAITAPA